MSKKKHKAPTPEAPQQPVIQIQIQLPPRGSAMAETIIASMFERLLEDDPPPHEVYQQALEIALTGFELVTMREVKDSDLRNTILTGMADLRGYLQVCRQPPLIYNASDGLDDAEHKPGPWPNGHPENEV
jgi:hypothetical protein